MATTKWSPKDPQDVRDYWIDFTLLLPEGVTIATHTAAVPADQPTPVAPFQLLAKVTDGRDATNKMVRVRFSGGSPSSYAIQYHIIGSDGQEFDLTKTLVVKERTA